MKTTLQAAAGRIYDVCVLGAGPAGITFALETLRQTPAATILLVEFGGQNQPARNALDESIRIENPRNHHEPHECTNKGLGGSSATWGGRCVMYDPVDFEPRPIVGSDCTWDSSFLAAVKPHVPRAAEILECGSGPFDLAEDPVRANARIADRFVPGDVTDTVVERWSMPTRFGPRYRAEIEAAAGLHLLEGCRAMCLGEPDDTGRVGVVTLRDGSGFETIVRSRAFVVAAGAQESTRLLLKSPALFRVLGGAPEALGRYYQGHVSGKIASVCFHGDARRTDYGFIREPDGTYLRRRFQFSAATVHRENLLNTAIWLDNPLYFDPAHRSGAMSFMYLAMITPVLGRKLAPPAIAHSVTKGKVTGVAGHFANIARGLPGSLWTPASIFYRRYLRKRKLPGIFLYSPENRYALHFHAEQVPDRANRMELGPDGETLSIHYELTEADVQSVIRCHAVLDRHLRASDCGHLEYWFTPEELPQAIREMSRDGIHQSGTTRIAAGPDEGVVDADLRVFGTENVFVCSSSVFPTSGQANPTFFMCAMAVRLAHHLARA